MKRIVVAFAVLIAAVFTVNAQGFIGGGLGVDYNSAKRKTGSTSTDMGSGFAFSFTPKAGYFLNDKFGLGLEVGLLSATLKPQSSGSNNPKHNLTGWGVDAFALYKLVEVEKITFLLAGSVGFGEVKTKYTSGSTTTNYDPITTFGVGILPVLSYSLTDRFNIDVACNFLRLGFDSTTEKSASNKDNKDTVNTFGLGVNSPTIGLGSYGDISTSDFLNISIIYKF